jgi:acetyl esterase/lipase
MGGLIDRFCFPLNGKPLTPALLRLKDCIDDPFVKYPYLCDAVTMQHNGTAVWIPASGADITILYAHGNNETIIQAHHFLRGLADDCHCNILAFEYPGYPGVPGSASTDSMIAAAHGAYTYLTTSMAIDPRQIILMGRSIGTGPITALAAQLSKDSPPPFAALVLVSPLASIRLAAETTVGSLLARCLVRENMFNNVCELPHVRSVPILLFHGTQDCVLPYNVHVPALVNAYNDAVPVDQRNLTVFTVEGGGHTDDMSSSILCAPLRQIRQIRQ